MQRPALRILVHQDRPELARSARICLAIEFLGTFQTRRAYGRDRGLPMTNRLILSVLIAALAGCSDRIRIGEPVHETKVLELDKSELTRVELKMGAGELRVTGNSPKLMEADFDYNSPGWKPEVDYHSTGVRADIQISNSASSAPHG